MRKEYTDEFDDEGIIIPDDFPDWTQINGVKIYNYYKVNRWFAKFPVFRLTWEEAQTIIDLFDDHDSHISEKLSNQLLQFASERT